MRLLREPLASVRLCSSPVLPGWSCGRNIPGSSLRSPRILSTNHPMVTPQAGRIQPSSRNGSGRGFSSSTSVKLVVRLAPDETRERWSTSRPQSLGRARYCVLGLGTLAGGELVTARPRPSCGGRLIASPVTRPSSARVAHRFLLPAPRVFTACRWQGPVTPGARLSPPSAIAAPHFPRVVTRNEQLMGLLFLESDGMCQLHTHSRGSLPASDHRICLQIQTNGSD